MTQDKDKRIAELEADLRDEQRVREKLAALLERITVVVHGPHPDKGMWSFHDLPERVAAMRTSTERACAELVREAARHNEGEALSENEQKLNTTIAASYGFAARRLRDVADQIETGKAPPARKRLDEQPRMIDLMEDLSRKMKLPGFKMTWCMVSSAISTLALMEGRKVAVELLNTLSNRRLQALVLTLAEQSRAPGLDVATEVAAAASRAFDKEES